MSGKPNRTPNDATNFRQAYLASLELQAKNDDVNLQANKIFKKTGQTPTQMMDYRTTEEKLADIERLKIDVRSELKQLADGQQADSIVQQLSNEELQFLAQHINAIITDIKPKYKYGILADVFIPYLQAYIKKAEISNNPSNIITREDLNNVLQSVIQNSAMLNAGLRNAIKRDIDELYSFLPNFDDLRHINSIQNIITRDTIRSELQSALEDIPTETQIIELLNTLDMAISHRDDRMANGIGEQLHQLLSIDPATREQIQDIKQQLQETKYEITEKQDQLLLDIGLNQKELQEFIKKELARMKLFTRSVSASERETIINDIIYAIEEQGVNTKEDIRDIIQQVVEETKAEQPSMTSATYAEAVPEVESFKVPKGQLSLMSSTDPLFNQGNAPVQLGKSRNELVNYINRIYPNVQADYPEIAQGGKANFFEGLTGQKNALTKYSYTNLKKIASTLNDLLIQQGYDTPIGGKGIKGKGISKSIRSKTDYSKGIMPVDKYVPFGRFHIDSHKLNDDIIALKRHTGCNVSGIPVQRVSNDMGTVIRTIVGGGQPSFNHLEKLSPEEKAYLYKLAKHSNIIDRISVPSPNKDDDEKDINQFEIMKGEIMNGNDSNELVKKFKILIMKMMKKDLLPKGQSKDILMDLVSLGY